MTEILIPAPGIEYELERMPVLGPVGEMVPIEFCDGQGKRGGKFLRDPFEIVEAIKTKEKPVGREVPADFPDIHGRVSRLDDDLVVGIVMSLEARKRRMKESPAIELGDFIDEDRNLAGFELPDETVKLLVRGLKRAIDKKIRIAAEKRLAKILKIRSLPKLRSTKLRVGVIDRNAPSGFDRAMERPGGFPLPAHSANKIAHWT